jgi:hypothetical protein
MALTCTETRSLDKFPYHKVDFKGYKIAMCIQWRIFIIFYNDDFVWLTDYDYVYEDMQCFHLYLSVHHHINSIRIRAKYIVAQPL